MKQKRLWITLSLFNLCFVALAGLVLRTKFLFPIPEIDYKHVLSAHSHFAFGGWVTLILMTLMIDNLLNQQQREKNVYQVILWGIQVTSMGMLFSFPFQGYGFLSIPFSTLFILFTYWFSWLFIKDLIKEKKDRSVFWLAATALACLVISSVGPFSLAYMMATNTGDAFLLRDAVYTFLHFQYNGFFTLAIFALYFNYLWPQMEVVKRPVTRFSYVMILSVIPALFLTMLWHGYKTSIFSTSIVACVLICLSLFYFFQIVGKLGKNLLFGHPLARTLLVFCGVAFTVKMILQMGTIIPSLGNAVFGFRPIIIGFLHLVFLGLVSFYVLAFLIQTAELDMRSRFVRFAVIVFFGAVIFNEAILLVDGIGLMLFITYPIYPWLLWIASIFLLIGAVLVFLGRLRTIRNRMI